MTQATRRQMTGDMRDQIASGTLPPGGRVPSEADLAVRYGLSRETVRKGLRDLQHEGLIVSLGSGLPRMVARREPLEVHVTARESVAWQADMERLGPVTPPRITVEIDGSTLIRDVERDAGGLRHNWARWKFPMNVAAGTKLTDKADIPEGAVAYLEEAEKWKVKQRVTVESRRSLEAEAARLDMLPGGGQVIAVERTGTTAAGKLVFEAVQVFRADRTRLVLDL